MKLYYSPGACSLSPHIVLLESGLPFSMEKIDLKSKKTEKGVDYLTINSKGAVPALQLDDGQVLTEGPAIVQYLRRSKTGFGLGAARRNLRTLSTDGDLELHLLRGSQELHPVCSIRALRRIGRKPRRRLSGKDSTGCPRTSAKRNILFGDQVHGGGCVSFHRARLDQSCGHRSRQVARARRISVARWSARPKCRKRSRRRV